MGDDKAYGCGGSDHPNCKPNDDPSLYEYDLSENSWTTRTDRSDYLCAGNGGGACFDDLFIWGGHAPAYNNLKHTKWSITGLAWSVVASLPHSVSYGLGYDAFGGYMWTARGVKYDYAGNVWVGDIACARSDSNVNFSIAGSLYTCGHYDNLTSYKYDPDAGVWITIANAYDNGYGPGGSRDGTYGYSMGGDVSPGSGNYYDRMRRYDAAANSWTLRTGSGNGSRHPGGYTLAGKAAWMCGYNCPGGCCASSYHGLYDNAGDNWISKASYPEPMNQIIGSSIPTNKPPNAPAGLSASNT